MRVARSRGLTPTCHRAPRKPHRGGDRRTRASGVRCFACPSEIAPDLLKLLAELCTIAISGTEAAAISVAAAADVPEGHRVDSEDALAAVGRLFEAEHNADAAERMVTAIVLRGEFDLKTALSVLELARALERATDRLAGFGHLLREHVLADLST